MAAEDPIMLGIGSAPGSIAPFVLVGLTASQVADMTPTVISGTGSYAGVSGTGSSAPSVSGSGSAGVISGSGGV